MSEKREFLICYDYGMGGLWGVMTARSEDEIHAQYPELYIPRDRPAWVTDDELAEIRDAELHDIDGAPWGMLNALLADRARE